MKLLPLSQGLYSKVDDDTFEKYGDLTWTAQKRPRGFHVARYFGKKYVYLHQLLLSAPKGFEIHHIDGDGLNNQRQNLKVVSRTEHRIADVHRRADNTSGYRGVWFHKQVRRWSAEIMHLRRKQYLGLFDTPEEAARFRDSKTRELGWPESSMNFPI